MDFGYPDDSFHTLTGGEQIGLLIVTLLLSAAGIALVVGIARRGRRIGLPAALLLFWAFVWLSPQVYYLYYQAIFDGLPWQIVVKHPPGPVDVVRLLTFRAEPTLSDHGKGLLGWALIGTALWRGRRARSEVAP
ncbi:hypothetical protein [Jannaschia marina]|uniref:hypothetical protein n=1 Tax=Jannaschia marina TaxID=2741674 RepID=UPI0015CB3FB7|nr:hypothetical protein [Jannaschia marina]